MSFRVTFCVNLPEDDCINEHKLEDNYEKFKLLSPNNNLTGIVQIGNQESDNIKIWDDMVFIVRSLCFRSITELLTERKECFLYTFFSHDSYLVIISPGTSSVTVFGDDYDHLPRRSFYRDDLLRELYYCGRRYVDLTKRLKEMGTSRFYNEGLETEAEKVKKVLGLHNIL